MRNKPKSKDVGPWNESVWQCQTKALNYKQTNLIIVSAFDNIHTQQTDPLIVSERERECAQYLFLAHNETISRRC